MEEEFAAKCTFIWSMVFTGLALAIMSYCDVPYTYLGGATGCIAGIFGGTTGSLIAGYNCRSTLYENIATSSLAGAAIGACAISLPSIGLVLLFCGDGGDGEFTSLLTLHAELAFGLAAFIAILRAIVWPANPPGFRRPN